ncbi:MAG TPA: CoA transferase [Acidiphilium sp.]|nr:MAG: acyl-CoA transferase [Acidiphilium sp. 21-60-14]OYV89692.1 MAG: acyl-CoA transferase [Acidiphilium sp. 37-60-79]OZB40886.1 MAG: acyl-CoA transferase [Acidiphilium sp. 34-60-192]HQT88563.1 CoA transferase [Acidiphilium sp.]HQU24368.1 CoA transferase [Acidiphilium sp.]
MAAEISGFIAQISAALSVSAGAVDVVGGGSLPSLFAVTPLAVASMAAAGLAVAELVGLGNRRVRVDRRLASLWFGGSIQPVDWSMPGIWDALAGDYRGADGWIKLHTNAPRHRAAALLVLGFRPDEVPLKPAVEAAVATWRIEALEQAIVEAGGCAAAMRSCAAWDAHPQGAAVAGEPLVWFDHQPARDDRAWQPEQKRPLAGLRVLDLTRVLAGPIATRFLAGFGADVMRIDPLDWDEPAIVPEVTLGKRCARLDLRRAVDRAVFEDLLAGADILVHGYRPGALDGLGYGAAKRQTLRPGLVDVTLDAYGWSGPWARRRGFDSLVQMSAGIADAGMRWRGAARPVPLPVQALDHATGYLMAAAAVRGLIGRLAGRGGAAIRVSLARTARLLVDAGSVPQDEAFAGMAGADFMPMIEQTDWGPAQRCAAPVMIEGAPMAWRYPAGRLGRSVATWLPREGG